MSIGTAITHLLSAYDRAKADKSIRKPISYAFYNTWKWCDTYEKERKENKLCRETEVQN